jgi:hypothetical protein
LPNGKLYSAALSNLTDDFDEQIPIWIVLLKRIEELLVNWPFLKLNSSNVSDYEGC